MLQGLQRLDAGIARLERAAVVLFLTTLIGLGLLQVLWRHLLAGGWFWAEEVLQHLVLWLGFLGASLATRGQRHLSIDLLAHLVPERWRLALARVVNGTALLVCGLLTHAAWVFVHAEYLAGTRLACGMPAWVAQSMMPLGFVLMAWRFALHGWALWRQPVHRQEHA